jgi:1-acyl-sn-glycerol-3-phosphate acyltransferase
VGLLYSSLLGLLRLGLRAYFQEVEVVGRENIPADGPCVIVANHHNSMMDPFLIVAACERPLAFIAKAPLFSMPLLGAALRGLGCIPAHRSQDPGFAKEKNQAIYEAAARTLASGRMLAVFPEGKSHSDPGLAEFRHGASRIAYRLSNGGSFRASDGFSVSQGGPEGIAGPRTGVMLHDAARLTRGGRTGGVVSREADGHPA